MAAAAVTKKCRRFMKASSTQVKSLLHRIVEITAETVRPIYLAAIKPIPPPPGALLGPYEIGAPLGAGGMGEVYRARDPPLHRDVALKILPTEVSADMSRRVRFEQEARAAAALNHPNILSVYDVTSTDAASYIASELVSGETLAALIARGPVPVRALLDIA